MIVLILTTLIDRAEAGSYIGLHNKGINLIIVCSEKSPHQDILRSNNLHIINYEFKNRLDLRAAKFIKQLIENNNVDLVHSFNSKALSTALIATRSNKLRNKIKHVAYRGTVGHLSRWDPSSWLTFLHPRVNKIVCVSEAVSKYLLSLNIGQHKVTTIHKGHDLRWYQDTNPADLSTFNINSDDFVITCAANMRAVKGVDLLIESLEFLPKNNIKLLLLGEVRDPTIRRQADKFRDKIIFAGFQNNPLPLIKSSDIFVMPSRAREGLPKAVIEAMSLGIPPVVTSVGGLPELVEHMVSGYVVPPLSSEEIAKGINFYLNNPDAIISHGKNAVQRIKEKFSVENTIENTFKVYKELIA